MRKVAQKVFVGIGFVLWCITGACLAINQKAAGDLLSPITVVPVMVCLCLAAPSQKKYRISTLALAGALFCWILGDFFYFLANDIGSSPKDLFDTVSDLLYTAVNILFAIGLTSYVLVRFRGDNRKRLLLDSFLLSVTSFVLLDTAFETVIGNTLETQSLPMIQGVDLFMTVYLVILLTLVFLIRGLKKGNFPAMIMLFAFVLYTLLDVRYDYYNIIGRDSETTLETMLYLLCLLLIGLAFANDSIEQFATGEEPPLSDNDRAGLIFTYSVMAIGLVMTINELMRPSRFSMLLVAGFAYLLMAKSMKVNALNRQLIRQQEEEKHALEEKVISQRAELSMISTQLENASYMDSLTGLYNRSFWRIYGTVHTQEKTNEPLTIYSIDLNFFKMVNDTYGHNAGDRVLSEVGQRLASLQDDRTEAFRMGGDQFLVTRCGMSDMEEAELYAEHLMDLLDRPLMINGTSIRTTASIGVASYPQDAQNLDQLVNFAESARITVKHSSNRSTCAFYDANVMPKIQRRHTLELKLQNLDYDACLEMYYQPQVLAETGELIGMEALLRWKDPDDGFISPAEFIPIAEEMGIMAPIGEWVTRQSARQIAKWNGAYGRNLVVGINVSPLQLRDESFAERFVKILAGEDAKAEWVDVEITEGIALNGNTSSSRIIHRLKDLGISLSVDDFGTGYASFVNMINFHFNRIKIAKELVDDLATKQNSRIIVGAITAMAKGMKLHTIAEGVEEREQLEILKELGCEQIQGYYFGKPLPANEFEEKWLKPNE